MAEHTVMAAYACAAENPEYTSWPPSCGMGWGFVMLQIVEAMA